MHYKYRINHLLSLLPAGIYPESVMHTLELYYQISPQIFHRDRYLLLENDEEIPYERLVIYAQVLAVSLDELITRRVSLV